MDRVPVAVQGGDAADRRGLVGSLPLPEPVAHPISLLSGRPSSWPQAVGGTPAWVREPWSPGAGSVLTVIVGQDDGPVPAILEEGGRRAEHTLGLDPACGSVHL